MRERVSLMHACVCVYVYILRCVGNRETATAEVKTICSFLCASQLSGIKYTCLGTKHALAARVAHVHRTRRSGLSCVCCKECQIPETRSTTHTLFKARNLTTHSNCLTQRPFQRSVQDKRCATCVNCRLTKSTAHDLLQLVDVHVG